MSIIVTGAANGIGNAVARAYTAVGYHVYRLDRVDKKGQGYYQIDVRNSGHVDKFYDTIGHEGISALINCAGVIEDNDINSSTETQWEEMLSLNLSSVFLMCKGFMRVATQQSAIVNVSSVNTSFGSKSRVGYAAAKGGVEALTKSLAAQLGPRTRVNCVVLGAIDTQMTWGRTSQRGSIMGRMGAPQEAANAIRFLASPEASFITGALLHVDGGYGLV